MTEEPILKVDNLQTYFFTGRGVVTAVDGVSFSVKKGETIGIVGESGCGKSVTMLSIMRLVPEPNGKIVGGKILFMGEDLIQKSPKEMRQIRGKQIALILQDPMSSLNPAYTIGNQMAEVIRLHQKLKGKQLRRRVIETLNMLKIPSAETRIKDYPHQFSGGMRQRVVGAIALSCQPSLLIADEPTTSLDVTIQSQYLKLLKDLQVEGGLSLILVTHNMGIVARMCDSVVVMYAGKVVESAGVMEIFDNPSHPYTQKLIGCITRMETSRDLLDTIAGQPPDPMNLPPGCRFYPRCSEREERCEHQYPPETVISSTHRASCWKIG